LPTGTSRSSIHDTSLPYSHVAAKLLGAAHRFAQAAGIDRVETARTISPGDGEAGLAQHAQMGRDAGLGNADVALDDGTHRAGGPLTRSNDQNLWIALRPGDVKERTFPRKIVLSQNSDQDRRWRAGSGRCAGAQGSPGREGVQRGHGQLVAAG
jgi:hypothetical protein